MTWIKVHACSICRTADAWRLRPAMTSMIAFCRMRFSEPTRVGRFVKRYKRFFADVILGENTVVAHVPNTGSLKGCLTPDAECVITESQNPERKLKATLQFLKTPTSWVGVNTSLPNAMAYEAWEQKLIPDWSVFSKAEREVKLSKETRLDLRLTCDKGRHHFVEVKNVTLAVGQTAQFPDAVTARGQKHLRELMNLVQEGHGAEILFVVQRQDCTMMEPADAIDPEYGRLLREAKKQGVVVRALACHIDPLVGVSLNPTPLTLNF